MHEKTDPGGFYPELSRVPFIQQIHPLAVHEIEMEHDISVLSQVSQNMAEVAIMPSNYSTELSEPNSSVPGLDVFRSWAKLRVDDLSAWKQVIEKRIADTCLLLAGDDED